MITTSTGAKKLESSDNWREIFPNPGTSAAGAHNATVDAQDRIQAEVAPIINGKRCSLGAASGDYVLLRNSTIAGKTDGAYKATKAIPANTDLDSTYLGSPITGGMVNELNNNLSSAYNLAKKIYNGQTLNISGIVTESGDGVAYFELPLYVQPTTSIINSIMIPGVAVIAVSGVSDFNTNDGIAKITHADFLNYKGKCALANFTLTYS